MRRDQPTRHLFLNFPTTIYPTERWRRPNSFNDFDWAQSVHFGGHSFIMRLNLEMGPQRTEKESKGSTRKGENDCRFESDAVRVCACGQRKSLSVEGVKCACDTRLIVDVIRRHGMGWCFACDSVGQSLRRHPHIHTSNNYLFPKVFSNVCVCAGQGCAMMPGCREFGDMFYV